MVAVITVAGVQVVTVDLLEIAVAGVISQVAEVQPVARVLMLWLTLRFHLTRLFWMREIYFVTGSVHRQGFQSVHPYSGRNRVGQDSQT